MLKLSGNDIISLNCRYNYSTESVFQKFYYWSTRLNCAVFKVAVRLHLYVYLCVHTCIYTPLDLTVWFKAQTTPVICETEFWKMARVTGEVKYISGSFSMPLSHTWLTIKRLGLYEHVLGFKKDSCICAKCIYVHVSYPYYYFSDQIVVILGN